MSEIVVRSDVAPDGSYVAAIEVGPDESWIVDRASALEHAAAVLEAVARADYDACVLRQLSSLGIETAAVGQLVSDLRADRPAIQTATPLTLVPGVSHRDGRGFLTIELHGDAVGQWELADAREHALGCLEVVATVDLDAGYRRALVGVIGLDDDRARAVVGALAEHREAPPLAESDDGPTWGSGWDEVIEPPLAESDDEVERAARDRWPELMAAYDETRVAEGDDE